MGEISEMMLDGTMCSECGDFIDTRNGYPTLCRSCQREHEKEFGDKHGKVACPICKRRVKVAGLNDHKRVMHGEK